MRFVIAALLCLSGCVQGHNRFGDQHTLAEINNEPAQYTPYPFQMSGIIECKESGSSGSWLYFFDARKKDSHLVTHASGEREVDFTDLRSKTYKWLYLDLFRTNPNPNVSCRELSPREAKHIPSLPAVDNLPIEAILIEIIP